MECEIKLFNSCREFWSYLDLETKASPARSGPGLYVTYHEMLQPRLTKPRLSHDGVYVCVVATLSHLVKRCL